MSTQRRIFLLFCVAVLDFASADFACSKAGYFADPSDCHSYYSCDANLAASHLTCTSQGYFSPDTETCELGACPVTTTPTTTTTVTSAPGFTCTEVGLFADPKDCRAYFRCDSNLIASHYYCMGGGGHFDTSTGGCAAGKC